MKKIIFVILLSFLHSIPAVAGLAKSTTCLALLQMVKHSGLPPSSAERQYILNSLQGLAEHIIKKPISTVEPNIAEGRISTADGYSMGFNPVQAAGRLRGIHEFMKKPEDDATGERRFSLMATVSGTEEINKFVGSLVTKSEWGSRYYRNAVIRSLQTPIAAGVVLTLLHAIDKLVLLNGAIIVTAGAVPLESMARFAALHTNKLKGQLEEIGNATQDFNKNKWMFRSMNFEIQKEILEESLKYTFDQPWQLSNQEPIDYSSRIAETVLMPFMKIFKPQLAANYQRDAKARKERSWVGVDLFLTTNSEGEPELQIIIRGTHKAPPFPKTSPKPKEEKQLDRGFVPTGEQVPAGIPVRN